MSGISAETLAASMQYTDKTADERHCRRDFLTEHRIYDVGCQINAGQLKRRLDDAGRYGFQAAGCRADEVEVDNLGQDRNRTRAM